MIVHPSGSMLLAERAHQLWSVHPKDLDRLGFTNKTAEETNIKLALEDGSVWRLGARELFYLAHLDAAVEQSNTPLPKTQNMMHVLRRFATTHVDGQPIRLSSEDSIILSHGILDALRALDKLWETANQRSLTEEEKWGPK